MEWQRAFPFRCEGMAITRLDAMASGPRKTGAQPHVHYSGNGVYARHNSDLLVTFSILRLVDTDRINPYIGNAMLSEPA
jgi:hypothetical protein